MIAPFHFVALCEKLSDCVHMHGLALTGKGPVAVG